MSFLSLRLRNLVLWFRKAVGDWRIPYFGPFIHMLRKRPWYFDRMVVRKAVDGWSSDGNLVKR